MTTSITTKPTMAKVTMAVLLRATIGGAWCLIANGERWWWRLDSLPVWVPGILWRLCGRAVVAGEALEAWAEGMAERLGIDMLDVLAPLIYRMRLTGGNRGKEGRC
jgi:hypothetical protein